MALLGIREAVIIFNPAAGRLRRGRGLRRLQECVDIFRHSGMAVELQPTATPGSAAHLARAAAQKEGCLVIACGGDGTLHEVVNGLAGSRNPLALLPAGTANVLAKELRLSWHLPTAARQIVAGELRRIALGLAVPEGRGAEARYFITLAGAGVDADMVYRVSEHWKKKLGMGAYWLAGLEQFLTYSYPMFRAISSQGEKVGSYIAIGRTKAHGFPVRITDGADLYSGEFELAVFSHKSQARAFLHGWAALLGRLRKMSDVHFWRTTEVRCAPLNGRRIHVQADGELIGTLPMTFRVVPDALTLVVPAQARAFSFEAPKTDF
jgi:YegS/Rv2252/BmrU family lipid kinase